MSNITESERFKQLGAQHPWLSAFLAEKLKAQVQTLVHHPQADVLHRAQGRAQQLEELINFLSPSSR